MSIRDNQVQIWKTMHIKTHDNTILAPSEEWITVWICEHVVIDVCSGGLFQSFLLQWPSGRMIDPALYG